MVILRYRLDIIICIALIMATVFVYFPILNFEFINFDTPEYVYKNAYVQNGLSLNSIHWALTTNYLGNWHPITWLSHMLDVEMFGLESGLHHLSSLLFHILNVILLLLILRMMTGESLLCGFVAGLFALHPLHIESVVWVAERKDLLSAFFCFLSVLAYILYTRKLTVFLYILVLFFFILSLMSKPMMVTLPFSLLLLDFWPLNRFSIVDIQFNWQMKRQISISPQLRAILKEKVPLLLITIIACIITFNLQKVGGAMEALDHVSLIQRLSNIFVSYAGYIYKMIVPLNLTIFYPYNEDFVWSQIVLCVFLFILITFCSLKYIKIFPWLTVGWFWYVGILVPVIGIVPIGLQAMADRYTYIPLLGIFFIVSWGLSSLLRKTKKQDVYFSLIALAVLLLLSFSTRKQLGYWQDGITLWSRSIEITKNNHIAYHNLGAKLLSLGRFSEARWQLETAVRLRPDFEIAHINLGIVYTALGQYQKAMIQYIRALELKHDDPLGHYHLAHEYYRLEKIDLAMYHYLLSLKYEPLLYESYYYLGTIMERQGQHGKAIELFKKALTLKPDFNEAKEALASIDNKK